MIASIRCVLAIVVIIYMSQSFLIRLVICGVVLVSMICRCATRSLGCCIDRMIERR